MGMVPYSHQVTGYQAVQHYGHKMALITCISHSHLLLLAGFPMNGTSLPVGGIKDALQKLNSLHCTLQFRGVRKGLFI